MQTVIHARQHIACAATRMSSTHAEIHARQQATRAATCTQARVKRQCSDTTRLTEGALQHKSSVAILQENTRATARQHTSSNTCAATGNTRGNKRTIIQARQHTARAATRMSSTHAATYAVPSAALRRYTVLIRVSAVSSGCYGVGPWPGHPGILP